ncbi:MAG: leucine-rich repeat protein, partial [Lachnospiraceae bacterium]|nr:leucine-rich repeat protein [Lachnospiraceae bacterium]
MKMKLKKVLGILLSVILICTMTPQASIKVKAVDNTVKALLTNDGTMYVIYDANSYSAGGTYAGKTITNVYDCDGGNGAMADYNENVTPAPWHGNRDNISAVVIGYGVTHIGDYAFGNGFEKYLNIVSAMLSSTVTSIGEGAFCACENLATVNIEAGSVLQSIGM